MSAEPHPSPEPMPPVDQWRPLIMASLPTSFGTSFGHLVEAVQEPWENMDNPPLTSVASAVIELVNSGELSIKLSSHEHVIRRGSQSNG